LIFDILDLSPLALADGRLLVEGRDDHGESSRLIPLTFIRRSVLPPSPVKNQLKIKEWQYGRFIY
jgi:hypothetical protein